MYLQDLKKTEGNEDDPRLPINIINVLSTPSHYDFLTDLPEIWNGVE